MLNIVSCRDAFNRLQHGLKVAKVIPPPITPPTTGIIFLKNPAKISFVIFTPNHFAVFFTMAQKAKKNKAYVVYVNGSVARAKKRSSKLVQPGCEIIVPAKQKRDGMTTTEIMSLGSTSAALATVVLALVSLLK